MNENSSPNSQPRFPIGMMVCVLLVAVVLMGLMFGTRALRARLEAQQTALRQQVAGTYVFNRASDGVVYTAEFRANGHCYFRVKPPGDTYSTSQGDISAGIAGPGCENGLEWEWSPRKAGNQLLVSAGGGATFTVAGKDLVHSDGSVYARAE